MPQEFFFWGENKLKLHFDIFGFIIPSYGLMIGLGVVLANVIAFGLIKKRKHDPNDFVVLEGYTFLGGFLGAKLLYILVSLKEIEWNRMLELDYFNQVMQGGFVFYGGLIGGLILVFVAGKLHRIRAIEYVRTYIFLIPFIHSFGRVGCFLAGCCYGVPYDGKGAVCYPEGAFAPSGIPLFPVQLVEAVLLLYIAVGLLFLQLKLNWNYTIETYLVAYSFVRFGLEFLRYDEARGYFLNVSTSQWISIGMIGTAACFFIVEKRATKKPK